MARELNLYSFVLTKGYKAPRSMNVMAFRADLHAFIKDLDLSKDERLAFKNAFMGSNKIGKALEDLGFSTCYFGHTHRIVEGSINGVDYHCYPIGTEHDWKKRCEVVNHNGFKLYSRTNELDFTDLVERYNPSESVLRLYTQMVESLQIVNL